MDFFLGITNKCNLSCPWCAHRRLRDMNPSYEMSELEFNRWYELTKKACYTFEGIDINGLGEPTCYSDQDFLKYMIIRCGRFTNTINILTNGTNINVLEKIIPFVTNVEVSLWEESEELLEFSKRYPKVHLHKDIVRHNISTPRTTMTSMERVRCGCSGCGYTMNTIFLVCGTWCPEIVKNGIYHTDLKENYLETLSKDYGWTAFEMCHKCHANVSIPYEIYGREGLFLDGSI